MKIINEIKYLRKLMNIPVLEESVKNFKPYNLEKIIMGLYPNTDLELFIYNFLMKHPNNEYYYLFEDDDLNEMSLDIFQKIMNTQDMKNYLNNILESNEIKNILNKIDESGNINIEREITVKKEWFDKLNNGEVKRLGIYWSHDFGSSVYGDEFDFLVVLHSKINEKHINWGQTIFQNITYIDSENEITLFKNTPISLYKIEYKKRDDKDFKLLNPSYYKNKVFFA